MSKLDEILDLPFLKELGKDATPTLQKKQQIKNLILDVIGKDEPAVDDGTELMKTRGIRNAVKAYQRQKVDEL